MADKKHLEIIKQGVDVWNNWREENPTEKPDLRDAKLIWEFITEIDASTKTSYGFDRRGTFRVEMSLHGVNFRGVNLFGADLSGAILTQANINDADLREANLSEAHLLWAELKNTDLSRANLYRADLFGANLYRTNLSKADLREADIIQVNLHEVELKKADLSYSEMSFCSFINVDLSKVKGIEKIIHLGPSSIDIPTIYHSKGKIPNIFLQGAGIPESFINNMPSLVGQHLAFYSCFISYSSSDQDFAVKLHADLQKKGVRCWFAQEDMKTGDKIRETIDQEIFRSDKLLLVLSDNSINSEWVEKEVETAFDEERKRKTTVLFPIMLDTAVMVTDKAWANDIRRTRHIGNFTKWRENSEYKKAFKRLINDLKR
jgi:hypothetical protein